MIAAYEALRAHSQDIDAPTALTALDALVSAISSETDPRKTRAATYSVGELLCGFLLSDNHDNVAAARRGIVELGRATRPEPVDEADAMERALAKTDASTAILVSIDHRYGVSFVDVAVRDVPKAARREAEQSRAITVEVILEDMRARRIATVAKAEGPVIGRVAGLTVGGPLHDKLLTVIADGVEVFSRRLDAPRKCAVLC